MKGWGTYAAAFLLGMAVVGGLAFRLDPHVNGRDFMHNGWIPARLILADENPYAPDQQRVRELAGDYLGTLLEDGGANYNTGPAYNAVYPFWALALQVPLGWLDFPTALIVWTLFSGAALVIAVLITLAAVRRMLGAPFGPRAWTGTCLAVTLIAVLFMPTCLHFFLGQYSALIFLALALAFRPGCSPGAGALAFALATMKPQLSALALGLMLLGWMAAAPGRAWSAAAATAALHLGPLAFFPHAVADWFSVNFLVQKQAYRLAPVSSSWWGAAYHGAGWLGSRWWVVAAILSVSTLLLLLRPLRNVWRDGEWRSALPLTVIVTLLVTPYTIAYDQVLLLLPAVWLWMRVVVAGNRQARLVGLALLVWSTLLPMLLLFAMEAVHSNYVKVTQTLGLLGLYYWTAAVTPPLGRGRPPC